MPEKCGVQVPGHGGFHWYPCDRPSKAIISDGVDTVHVCGIHRNEWERRKKALGDEARFGYTFTMKKGQVAL